MSTDVVYVKPVPDDSMCAQCSISVNPMQLIGAPQEVLNHRNWLYLMLGSRMAATLDALANREGQRVKLVPIEYSMFRISTDKSIQSSLSTTVPIRPDNFFRHFIEEITVTGPLREIMRENAGIDEKGKWTIVKEKIKSIPIIFHFEDQDVESELWQSDSGFACMPSMGDGWTQYVLFERIEKHSESLPLVYRGSPLRSDSELAYDITMTSFSMAGETTHLCFGSTCGAPSTIKK